MNARSEPRGAARAVHVVVPDAIDDPLRPSGGNSYDRRICAGLAAAGWRVHEHPVPDAWPRLGRDGVAALAAVVARLPDAATVLVDGLLAEACSVLVPAARRLTLVVLVHAAPDRHSAEVADVLRAARGVVATSEWVRAELSRTYPPAADRIVVAVPGVEPAPLATGSPGGGRLLCLGALAPHKGQDVLVAALARIAALRWECRCVGSRDHDPRFVRRLHSQVRRAGLTERVTLTGPVTGAGLESEFMAADVLVHPARIEGYGMVVTEALAHGLPVLATTAGGVVEALGTVPGAGRPGLLVPVDDPAALGRALSSWLTGHELRRQLGSLARARRDRLPQWSATVRRIAGALERAA